MTKRLLLLLPLFVCFSRLPAQETSIKDKAYQLAVEGITLMDNGEYDQSISLLKAAQVLDPDRIEYGYEIGLAYYLKESYTDCIEELEKIRYHEDAFYELFHLLGDAVNLSGKPETALSIYEEGILKFPRSGVLYMGAGLVENKRSNLMASIEHWEAGIKVDPAFSSNYYWLAKAYAQTEELVWSFIYGELFMAIDPVSERSQEISKLLYDNYQRSYLVLTDSSGEFRLTKKGFEIITLDKRKTKTLLPFEGTYATTFTLSAMDFHHSIDLETIAKSRTSFISIWFEKNNQLFPNLLFEYHRKMIESGIFNAYTHWLISAGDPVAYDDWLKENEAPFNDFAKWFSNNPIVIESTAAYARPDY